jgi:hypothetical protein
MQAGLNPCAAYMRAGLKACATGVKGTADAAGY